MDPLTVVGVAFLVAFAILFAFGPRWSRRRLAAITARQGDGDSPRTRHELYAAMSDRIATAAKRYPHDGGYGGAPAGWGATEHDIAAELLPVVDAYAANVAAAERGSVADAIQKMHVQHTGQWKRSDPYAVRARAAVIARLGRDTLKRGAHVEE